MRRNIVAEKRTKSVANYKGGLNFPAPAHATRLLADPHRSAPLYLTPCALQPLMRHLSVPDRFPFRPAIETNKV